MADFDNEVLQQEQNRMALFENENQNLQNHFQHMTHGLHYLRNVVQQSTSQAPPPRKSLNLTPPPTFSRIPSEIYSFKLRLCQFLGVNNDTYTDSQSQLLYAGSLLSGTAGQRYESLVDLDTFHLPSTYTIDTFL